MNKNLYVVLMAGGAGTRFWPYSRNRRPKQFLDVLKTGRSLLQATFDRCDTLCPNENILVVTTLDYVGLVKEQLPELTDNQILGEPIRRNTAPCIALAAHKIASLNPNAVMAVCPSDHLILSETKFRKTIRTAVKHAETQDKLITLGIVPTRPETGYGYIQFIDGDDATRKVKTFTEKPELALAEKFLESKDFLWNAGIFVWGVQAILKAMATHLPDLSEVFEEVIPALNTPREKAMIETAYGQSRSISIDYGILEKANNVYVLQCDFPWSDLGSWPSLFDHSKKDKSNNSVEANALIYDSSNCIIRGPADQLIVVDGLNDYLIGSFNNVVVVCKKDREELFRRMVNDLKGRQDGETYL